MAQRKEVHVSVFHDADSWRSRRGSERKTEKREMPPKTKGKIWKR